MPLALAIEAPPRGTGAAHDAGPSRSPRLEAALVAGFGALVLVRILHHAMWRDELQAWMLARWSESLPDLFRNLRYEGHPALWHLVLYALSAFTDHPVAMQVLHALIATASVAIVVRYAPFTPLQKALFAFGYFPFFEYATVSRGYALGVLLVFAFLAVYTARRDGPRPVLALSVLLALLVQTSVYGVNVAFALGLLVFGDVLSDRRRPAWHAALGAAIVLASTALAVWQVLGVLEGTYTLHGRRLEVGGGGAGHGLARAARLLWETYLPVPPLDVHFWNENILGSRKAKRIMSAALAGFFLFAFARRRDALLVWGAGTLGLLAFSVKLAGSVRHNGHLFVVLLAACWLAARGREAARLRSGALTAILAVHVAAAAVAVAVEAAVPFSASEQAARWIEREHPGAPVVGDGDNVASALAGHLRRPIHYASLGREGTFLLWDAERTPEPETGDVVAQAIALARGAGRDVVLALNYEPCGDELPLDVVPVEVFDEAIVRYERYWLYLVRAPR